MNTVLTHFHNEEYLLPWWIDHHSKLFDNGIMINYHSTDRSVEICKELCPKHWKIVNTVNDDFSPDPLDQEIKYYENSVEGFKLTLTTTEFLLTPKPLSELNKFLLYRNVDYVKLWGVCMVDVDPYNLPTHAAPLFVQKCHGMISGYAIPNSPWGMDPYNVMYGRYYHNQPFGKYGTGRHRILEGTECGASNVFTLKYKYSPWNETTIKRVQQFGSKLPNDISSLHKKPELQHQILYNHFLMTAYDLRSDTSFLNAYDYCLGLV